jgi:hypothetical protein
MASRDRASSWSLATVEPVSPPRRRKLENSEQRPAPETRVQRTELPEVADQRPVPANLLLLEIDGAPVKRARFRDPQPMPVHGEDQSGVSGAITVVPGGLHKPEDFVLGQMLAAPVNAIGLAATRLWPAGRPLRRSGCQQDRRQCLAQENSCQRQCCRQIEPRLPSREVTNRLPLK